MSTLHYGGASGVLLKFNFPSSALYADILGLLLEFIYKFNTNVHCLIRRQNKFIGNFVSVLQSPEIIFFPKFVFIFLLHLFYLPLDTLDGLLLSGSDCNYLWHYILNYPNNVFLDSIPSP